MAVVGGAEAAMAVARAEAAWAVALAGKVVEAARAAAVPCQVDKEEAAAAAAAVVKEEACTCCEGRSPCSQYRD